MYSIITKMILSLLFISTSALALDQGPKKEFNLDNIRYQYQSDGHCNLKEVDGTVLRFTYDPAKLTINAFFNDKQYYNYSPIDNLNKGKMEFNSCWSDGFMGYRDNKFYDNTIIGKTVIVSPGFFCMGGRDLRVREVRYSFKKDKLFLRVTYADYDRDEAMDETCSFTRINF
jgi:hypothetical protein